MLKPAEPISNLSIKLEQLYAVSRTAVTAAVLIWMLTAPDAVPNRSELIGGVIGYAFLVAILRLALHWKPTMAGDLFAISLTLDVLFITYLISFSGGPASTFYLLYYLVIVFAAYYYNLNVGVGVALAITILYLSTNTGLVTRLSPVALGLRLAFGWFLAFSVGLAAGFIRNTHRRLLKLLDTLNESTTELERSQVRVETIYETSRALGELRNEKEITAEVLNIVETVLGYEMCSIFLAKASGKQLREIARLNMGKTQVSGLPPASEPVGIIGEVFHTGTIRRAIDLPGSENYIGFMKAAKSSLSVPMISYGKVVGVLNAESTRTNDFTEMDEKVFAILASSAGMAYENSRLQEQLKQMVIIDELTGIHNYRYFTEKLAEEKRRAVRYRQPLSLIMIDIDWFKRCNDSYGHEAGNVVLQEVVEVVRGLTRDTDTLARYGGEEFILILPQTGHEDARLIAERIRQQIEHSVFGEKAGYPPMRITVSVGVTTYPDNNQDHEELITLVDQAMYQAKGLGKNRVAMV